MKIATQRKIDRWAGVLICRLFSLINLKKPDQFKAPQIRRILIILLSELGSLILSYPMLKRLESKYPNATIHYLVFAQNAEALKLLEAVPDENIFPHKKPFLYFLGQRQPVCSYRIFGSVGWILSSTVSFFPESAAFSLFCRVHPSW